MANKAPLFSETISLAATVRSTALNVGAIDSIGYALRTTGNAAGTWRVQYSNDFIPGVDDATLDTKWDEYTLAANPPDAAGSAQTFGIRLDAYEYKFVRIKFSYTSGAGSALIAAQMKGV